MRLFLLSAAACLLVSCVTGGVNLDDSGTPEGDTDTDADADTDTDTDTDGDTDTDLALPEAWVGDVTMELVDQGQPFCGGLVSLVIQDSATLTGDGACELMGGPGQGQSLQLDFAGSIVADGVVTGQITLTMPDMPEPPPAMDMKGQVTVESLQLDFELEIGPPDDPDDAQVVQGSVNAVPED